MLKTRVASLLILLVALAIPAPAGADSGEGRIAFVSTYSGDADILSANVDAGLTVCEGPTWLDTGSVGSKTFSVRAGDAAGNETLENRGYDVVYDWAGFASPVDNPSALNVFKAGHGVPLRFSLGGYHGLSVVMDWAPISRQIPCDSTELGPWGTQTAGSLSYNESLDRYTYLWQTDRAWAGTCRQLMIALDDRTYHFASFRFTK